MPKSDTATIPNSKTTLQDVLTRAADTPPVPRQHTRRAVDRFAQQPPQEAPASIPAHFVGADPDLAGSGVVLEQVSRKPYDLSFTYLLIPRFPSHFLIGDISEYLHGWMRDICLSFEWRLEMLSIRPEYMHWVFFVPANTPPSQCVRIVREQTSRRIFREIPHIRRENMSPDFWAPGYLVRMGPTPYTADMIADFVRLIRQHQGIQPRPSV